jgi:hypothetical protein
MRAGQRLQAIFGLILLVFARSLPGRLGRPPPGGGLGELLVAQVPTTA